MAVLIVIPARYASKPLPRQAAGRARRRHRREAEPDPPQLGGRRHGRRRRPRARRHRRRPHRRGLPRLRRRGRDDARHLPQRHRALRAGRPRPRRPGRRRGQPPGRPPLTPPGSSRRWSRRCRPTRAGLVATRSCAATPRRWRASWTTPQGAGWASSGLFNSKGRASTSPRRSSPTPAARSAPGETIPVFHHVGVYAYAGRRSIPIRLALGPLENSAGLEQLDSWRTASPSIASRSGAAAEPSGSSTTRATCAIEAILRRLDLP